MDTNIILSEVGKRLLDESEKIPATFADLALLAGGYPDRVNYTTDKAVINFYKELAAKIH